MTPGPDDGDTLPGRQRTVRLDGIPGENHPRLFDSTPTGYRFWHQFGGRPSQ